MTSTVDDAAGVPLAGVGVPDAGVGAPAGLGAHQVTVSYGRRPVLDRVDLHLAPGETVGLRGPSGSGKSTLARVLALLHAPDTGHVVLDGQPVAGARHRLPAAVRTRVAILFQSPRAATDPRLSLADIIAEPLRATGTPREPTADRTAELADLVGLTPDLLARRPHAVSDGQLQRACLARALAHRPGYLLCDEATAMLDASTQAHVAAVVSDYQRQHAAGVLVITHDPALLARWTTRVVDLPAHGAG
ncbi:dipeptide/oligopeptide/nickel ABC transporter ATP-binding protein [Solwaraspora sp. WMMD1047]|uniref:ABC transporter ATP-binding protein n=1 Tax=Solwaraspora sp. WMMD1047 TaxID=3016102 RepID=UPI0024165A53|nr:dipeptide/oligopeptide/nickel ABC transporter ATP-binding protein [Solwaraspora sp. WMMD1047]MDG4830704.1 dipeptide/oligopeptide/nickel ABC transporter ATP-binding protein [Solwaraspora sp. WMMD1047]